MINNKLIIDTLIDIDDTGMPKAPTLRQLLDKDVKDLWLRDKSKTKSGYIAECIIIYYIGDPKSPANQSGLSEPEALKMAIEQAGLPNTYIPDALVLRLIKKYKQQNLTEAGRVVENILRGIHNINLSVSAINNLLNEKLNGNITLDDLPTIITMVDNVNKKASEIPSILKKLEEAKQNLLYEKETETTRGGGILLSSMDSEDN